MVEGKGNELGKSLPGSEGEVEGLELPFSPVSVPWTASKGSQPRLLCFFLHLMGARTPGG